MIGVFGGIDIPSVTDFMDGFATGIDYYNEKNGMSVEVLGWDTKNYDVSVVQVVRAIVNGKFIGGVHMGTLGTGEVGLAPFYNLDSLISYEVKVDLEKIKADIIAGRIKTKP